MGGSSLDGGNALTVDGSGNVYTTGVFTGTVDFDPNAGSFDLGPTIFTDIFIQKLDTDGDLVWASAMGGSSYDVGNSIAIDAASNVYTTGYFGGDVDFDPSAGTLTLTSLGGNDFYVQKLDSDGNLDWAKSAGGTESDITHDLTFDNDGNVLITGYYDGTVDFDPGAGTSNLTAVGNTDLFVLKLSGSGDFIWAFSIGGELGESIFSIHVDAAFNIYSAGYFGILEVPLNSILERVRLNSRLMVLFCVTRLCIK
jgi:hypothetical protein